ncbi:MAG TPA: M48 family metallopeptidase [Burkholderiales bacterium]|nr:M48 family metallopeptidase [Burkholderiales bacterium]
MSSFGILFLAALALATATRLWLGLRHIGFVRNHRSQVPDEFSSEISLAAHQKAADYTVAKTRLALIGVMIEAFVALAFTFGGGLRLVDHLARAWAVGSITHGLLLIALVVVVTSAIELPFSLYRVFVIEERFGFNKMTLKLFFIDMFKAAAVAGILGLPLVAAVLWLMERMGEYWWIYAWVLWVIFNLFMLAVYPTWIAPLFNKFSPMENPELRERVERLLARCGFKVKGLMVMDGSTRSTHGNAYFTGFGKAKRIVFFDTLLERLNPAEVEAVLAHELGHFRLHHVMKRMAWVFLASLAFLWLLGFLMQQQWFYTGLNVAEPSTGMALVVFSIVVPQFTFLLQPFGAMYSRKHEFEADQYAVHNASASDLVSALVKLYKDNASTLTPDPLHSAFYDSHPPATVRIARLEKA